MANADHKFILVPVRVDVLSFKASDYFYITDEAGTPVDPLEQASEFAIFAPTNPPNYRNLQLNPDLIQHDILEPLNLRGVDLNGAYMAPRLWNSYPPALTHDLGMSATPSAKDVNDKEKLRQGFKDDSGGGSAPSAAAPNIPVFRPVPDRWLIIRHIKSDGVLGRWELSDSGTMDAVTSGVPSPSRIKVFVVESNRVRNIDQIPPTDDLLATTSAYVDPTQPLENQGDMFLGCSSSLQDWVGDLKTDPTVAKQYISLTIERTGNPFFADYQPQNPGVFSFYDDLTAHPGDPEYQADTMTVLMSGTVSYTIVGYHSGVARDPLIIDPNTPSPVPSHRDRLKSCFLQMNTDGLTPEDLDWLPDSQMRTLCHGNALCIDWNPRPKEKIRPQPRSPADMAQEIMRKSHPVAVGTNAIDALLGWMRANTNSPTTAQSGNELRFTPTDISTIAQQLLKLQTLVQSVDDDVDSQLEAADMLATNNFVRHAGGKVWHLKKDTNNIDQALPKVRSMNISQHVLDAYLQESAQLRLDLFEEWWKYAVDRDLGSEEEKTDRIKAANDKVRVIVDRLEKLGTQDKVGSLINKKYQEIGKLRDGIECEPGVKPPFVSQQDPTVLFAGIPSGRDEKLMGNTLPVRLSGQEKLGLDGHSSDAELNRWLGDIDGIDQTLQGKVSLDLIPPILSLLKEAAWKTDGKEGSVPPYGFVNDGICKEQAWYPLFVEWTIEYYHIPIDSWEFSVQGPEAKVQYGIKDGVNLSNLPDIQDDFRVISGRSPVLPQVTNSLQTTLKQLFSRMNPDELEGILSADDRKNLLRSVTTLQYLSITMAGFTDQLLTRMPGTHLQPNCVSDIGTSTPLDAACEVGLDIGLDKDSMALMDVTAPYTPFASLTAIPADPSKVGTFKPCTHGQFRFTKLALVDKFGQVVTPINVLKPPDKNPIFPCLSQTYSLETLPDGTVNSVLQRGDEKVEFVQLPPTLNQPARVNADFITYDDLRRGWRPLDDWENPVSGWIVLNFPGYSIQVFDDDGHFIREFQVMNASSTVCYPFKTVDVSANVSPLLRGLMANLANPNYLHDLFNTLSEAAEAVKHPPTAYAESMLSIMGRPLALVQMGFSLELCNAPLVNQSTIAPDSPVSITDYEFCMKLGDMDNTLDGLSGYFDLNILHPGTSSGSKYFKLDKFYSYFASSEGEISTQIPGPFKLKPYYVPPDDNVMLYASAHDWKRQIVAALVDPFVPVHAYTEILPTKVLSLPSWVIESGIKRVSAFFRMGPLLIPGDVPQFELKNDVDHDYMLDEKNIPTTTGKVPIPSALQKDNWVWLQPFLQSDNNDGGGEDTKYNFLDVDHVPEQPVWSDAPRTVVEGYLQMRKPFGVGDTGSSN